MNDNVNIATQNTALTHAIEKSGYKRKFIAASVGISRAQLWNLEHGRDFDTAIGYKLATLLNTTIDAISPHSPLNSISEQQQGVNA